jgi:ATP-binding cassette subfamily B protein
VQEKAMLNFFKANSEEYRQNAVTLSKIESLYFPSMALFIGISTLLTIMVGGLQYVRGENNIGLDTIVEFVIYINMLTFPVSAIGWTASMIQRAAASQKRLNEFLHTNPVIKNHTSSVSPVLTGQISFQQVNFTYPNTGIQAIKNFNLEINKGEKVAIVGKTGSGKTTVIQLLLRMYDANSGTISLDGINIEKINLKVLREQMSYVPQDGFLYSDTIENNINFGFQELSKEEIRQAAKASAVDKEIASFPKGYKTMVGERGVTLSGGQKQRVSIARALIKNAAIIILDDSLSAIDARTEQAILSNIDDQLKNKTSIIITHKIMSITNFDKIVVMNEGEIIEMGRHQYLIDKKGVYYEMYLRQLVQEKRNGL